MEKAYIMIVCDFSTIHRKDHRVGGKRMYLQFVTHTFRISDPDTAE